jgi:patatin-related protein
MTIDKTQVGEHVYPRTANLPEGPVVDAADREVRFAVVMYGGVSLAIYIYGVAQELLRLVRATARRGPAGTGAALLTDQELRGSERVYRRLSHLVAGEKPEPESAGPVRFVVDIVSGTSAGGINGVFLAKALANQQDIDPLQQLWLSKGDLATLLNTGLHLLPQERPQSLLDSQKMYAALCEALRQVEETNTSSVKFSSPLVDQLDLYVTTTDIRGLTMPIRLADGVVYERRYRNVFHFVYATQSSTGDDRNDFLGTNDPFLAFAARATSAFPFAFEPMRLADVPSPTDAAWQKFYRDYLRPTDDLPFPQRAFGDGGYLDNKPFRYATDMLAQRRADRPVDRKLIYIEPSPEHPEIDPTRPDSPDVVENINAAVLKLPRVETIREEINRVREINRLREHTRHITTGLDDDILQAMAVGEPLPAAPPSEAWARLDLGDLVRTYGAGYVGYHRLKIADATDGLTALIMLLANFNEDSALFDATHDLVREWRDRNYLCHRDANRPLQPTQNQFLMNFGFQYRLRRLRFLLERIRELDAFDHEPPIDAVANIVRKAGVNYWPSGAEAPAFRTELWQVNRYLNDIYCDLRAAARRLRSSDEHDQIRLLFADIGLTDTDLMRILNAEPEHERPDLVKQLVDAREPAMNAFAQHLARRLKEVFDTASQKCLLLLNPQNELSAPARAVRLTLAHYYNHFDDYDIFLYPIQYGTHGAEASNVEILRISPEDARCLIVERPNPKLATCLQKLAGTTVAHFGGFLDRLWRQNDILWGRLDGAERLITAIWPHPADPTECDGLIAEAQAAIVAETIEPLGLAEAHRLLVEAFMRTRDHQPDDNALRTFHARLMQGARDPNVRAILEHRANLQTLLDDYHKAFEEDRRPKRKETLRIVARATVVVGKMLDGLGERYSAARKPAAVLVRMGRILWGFIEVAVPRSLPRMVFHHWLHVLYLLEALLWVGGWMFGKPPAQEIGAYCLAVTAGVHILVTSLGLWLGGRRWWLRLILFVLGVVTAALIAMGVMEWHAHLRDDLATWLPALYRFLH